MLPKELNNNAKNKVKWKNLIQYLKKCDLYFIIFNKVLK